MSNTMDIPHPKDDYYRKHFKGLSEITLLRYMQSKFDRKAKLAQEELDRRKKMSAEPAPQWGSLDDRVLEMIRGFVNATRFKHLLLGLNANEDLPPTTKEELQASLKRLLEKELIRKHGNTNAYIDVRRKRF